jgi:hypothetical protein
MRRFDGESGAVDYPQGWQASTVHLLGVEMAIFAPEKLNADDLGRLDFSSIMFKEPLVVLMIVPENMTAQMGLDDLDTALQQLAPAPEDEIKMVKQGETTIGGIKGQIVSAEGQITGTGMIGVHAVAARRADGSVVVLMGVTPEQNLDQNMLTFEAMQQSFAFK